jgi:diadenosine tetraphosphate (Ap4A) HIT family hydrolase
MESSDCPLCRKLHSPAALSPEESVWHFACSEAFLGPWQYFHGYCILVARRHASELSQLPEDERVTFLQEMCTLARAVEECFHPHKLNYELLGNLVPHLHWHIFPRYADDPEAHRPVWFAIDRAERDESEANRLRQGSLDRTATVALLQQRLALK